MTNPLQRVEICDRLEHNRFFSSISSTRPAYGSHPRCTPSGLIMMYERSMAMVGLLTVDGAVVAET